MCRLEPLAAHVSTCFSPLNAIPRSLARYVSLRRDQHFWPPARRGVIPTNRPERTRPDGFFRTGSRTRSGEPVRTGSLRTGSGDKRGSACPLSDTPIDLAMMSDSLQTEQSATSVKEEPPYSPTLPRASAVDESSNDSDSSSPDDLPGPVAWSTLAFVTYASVWKSATVARLSRLVAQRPPPCSKSASPPFFRCF